MSNGYSADSEAFSGDEGLMSGVEVSSGYLSAAGTTSGGDIENNRNKTWPRKQKKLPTVARRTTNSFIWSIRVRPDLNKNNFIISNIFFKSVVVLRKKWPKEGFFSCFVFEVT